MKVSNFHGVKNQFIYSVQPNKWMDGTETKSGTMFQSYDSNIVLRQYDGKIFLDAEKWDYSTTTGKYRNLFLNETKKETEKKIKSGEYTLINLN